MKQAILAVSFGTTHHDTLEQTIGGFERALAKAFPHRTLVRCFTSNMIIKILAQRDGLVVPTVAQALADLEAQGYDDVLMQPSHVLNGEEYDKLCAQSAPYQGRFARLAIGKALLSGTEDYMAVAQALLATLPAKQDHTAVVYMGHGSEHFANSAYALLEYVFHDLGRNDIFIGTVEGYPALEQVMTHLSPQHRCVLLKPLMIVAGDHAKNDLAGDEADSWKCQLEQAGYQVTCQLRGLGELDAITQIFCDHAKQAEESV